MAWHEYMKASAPEGDEMMEEVAKDLDRLQVITERFSKIGSVPVLEADSLQLTLQQGVGYMARRVSDKVKFSFDLPEKEIRVALNKPLFDWVLENLIKNALDAMNGSGSIHIALKTSTKNAIIDITDSGKGIPKSQFQAIFKPGITTRKRGWGLGLTLVKRIVEKYHKGKIFVKASEPGKGATFRILLPLTN
jgi:signal transduction histidine kinase